MQYINHVKTLMDQAKKYIPDPAVTIEKTELTEMNIELAHRRAASYARLENYFFKKTVGLKHLQFANYRHYVIHARLLAKEIKFNRFYARKHFRMAKLMNEKAMLYSKEASQDITKAKIDEKEAEENSRKYHLYIGKAGQYTSAAKMYMEKVQEAEKKL